jgi:hypothetical protein
MNAPQFKKAISVTPSKATRDRVQHRLTLREITLSPKRRPLINQPLNNVTRSLSKALVWTTMQ